MKRADCRIFWRQMYKLEKYLRQLASNEHLASVKTEKLLYLQRMLICYANDMQRYVDEFEAKFSDDESIL